MLWGKLDSLGITFYIDGAYYFWTTRPFSEQRTHTQAKQKNPLCR